MRGNFNGSPFQSGEKELSGLTMRAQQRSDKNFETSKAQLQQNPPLEAELMRPV